MSPVPITVPTFTLELPEAFDTEFVVPPTPPPVSFFVSSGTFCP